MPYHALIFLALAAIDAEPQTVIDAFDVAAPRERAGKTPGAWRPVEATPPLTTLPLAVGPGPRAASAASSVSAAPSDRQTTKRRQTVFAPFGDQPKMPRVSIDRDLAPGENAIGKTIVAASAYQLTCAVDHPEAIASWTLYFHSGDGWYAGYGRASPRDALDAGASPPAGAASSASGMRGAARSSPPLVRGVTVRFERGDFGAEGQPKGWDAIDGIRISAWRGAAINTRIALVALSAVVRPVALVVPDDPAAAPPPAGADSAARIAGRPSKKIEADELRTAFESAAIMADMLADIGLPADRVSESRLVAEGLAQKQIAVVAYHPALSAAADQALVHFTAQGGKVFIAYRVPPRLAAALGLGEQRYVRPEGEARLAEIRFGPDRPPGMPESAAQASWNINAVEPQAAKVVARWFDRAGRPTPYAALVQNARGAFFSHIVLPDDREHKLQMMAAVLGSLEPSLWKTMAAAAVGRAERIGHLKDTAALRGLIDQSPAAVRERALASFERGRAVLEETRMLLENAEARASAGSERFANVAAETRAARDALVEAYLLAAPSIDQEGRAVWNHDGAGGYPGDWPRAARALRAAGVNIVFPNLLWGGLAHYDSKLLPTSDTFRRYGDQAAQCCQAAKAEGLQVHAWKVNFNLQTAPRSFVAQMRAEGRTQVSATGEPIDWLCPSNPANRELECASLLEVAAKYPVDGVHLDYIRYPNADACFCDGCRRRFEAETRPVEHWPADCRAGARREEYNAWRCRQITALVRMVHERRRALATESGARAGARKAPQLSAAVFGGYPSCRDEVAQDWPLWVREGLVDFVCPMDYTADDAEFNALVRNQVKLVGGRVPIYAGIGATASNAHLAPDQMVGQALIAREAGANGFTIFEWNGGSAAELGHALLPAAGAGIGAKQARPPR